MIFFQRIGWNFLPYFGTTDLKFGILRNARSEAGDDSVDMGAEEWMA
jgi:hypothetical protein